MCANLKGLGTNWPGSFAEYVVVPASLVFSVDGIDPDISVFTEPTACAMHGVETLSPRPGSSALVFGAGPDRPAAGPAHRARRRRQRDGGGVVGLQAQAGRGASGSTRTFLMDRADLAGDAARLKAVAAAASTSWSTPPARPPCPSSACR